MSLVSIPIASEWASKYLKKDVSPTNISYLVQYGKIKKHSDEGSTLVDLNDLKKYYRSWIGQREINWKSRLGNDLNWALSFDNLREKDTTKHVHRLHPYKGKYIPQLVEYFLDDHIDDFKKSRYFNKGDIVLDPFLGSGTTTVQSIELGIHSIGIDVSAFNCMISVSKVAKYDIDHLEDSLKNILEHLKAYEKNKHLDLFEEELLSELSKFNQRCFPSPGYKYDINRGLISEKEFSDQKEKDFLRIYNELVDKYKVKLKQKSNKTFLDVWYIENVRTEIDYVFSLIRNEEDVKTRKILALILSRAIRSCRATTHSDLATLKEPQISAYYCYKHKKICKPLFSIKKIFSRYAYDTIKRLRDFDKLRVDSLYSVITGDSRSVDIIKEVSRQSPPLADLVKKNGIDGIFCSPPYVGQIDYHEQHAYAYDLLGFDRNDESEIGPLYKGQGVAARKSYVEGISDVLNNCKKYLKKNYDVFLVANDKYNLYPEIADRCSMTIVDKFKRPVLNRTERGRNPYSEMIFHFKEA